MKKLDYIPKKNVFEAPDGYFDRLPGIIQSRVADDKESFSWAPIFRVGLRYALPVVIIVVAVLFYVKRTEPISTEDLIASVDSASLAAFLDESDLSTDDLLESVPLDHNEAEAIQHQTIEEINLSDDDFEYLNDELGNDY